jgi:hypothetical protein
MSQLDELEKLVLDGARRGMDPGAGYRRELFASLEMAALKGCVPSLPEDEVPSLELERVSLVAERLSLGVHAVASSGLLLKLSSLAALTGGLLGFFAGYLTFGGEGNSAIEFTRPPRSAIETQNAIVSPAEARAPKAEPTDANKEQPRAPLDSQLGDVVEPAQSVKRTEKKTSPQRLEFHEELSHLRRAQLALKQGNPELAWGLMRSLDELRPGGALLPERRMTKVLALCALDRKTEAQGEARRLLESKQNSVYSARLKTTCASPLEN